MQLQLVVPPCSSGTFASMVRHYSISPRLGLKLLTHHDRVIDVWDDVTIKMEATEKNLDFATAYLTIRSPRAEHHDGTCCLTTVEDHVVTVYCRPPKPMEYCLIVRGRAYRQPIKFPGQEQVELQQMVAYIIRCRRAVTNALPFPSNKGFWGLHMPVATQCGLKRVKGAPFAFSSSLDGEVTVPVALNSYTEMACKLRHALAMGEELSHYTILNYMEGGAAVTARLPRAGHYMLRVFAKHPTETSMQHVADYLLLTETSHPELQPFPRTFNFAFQQRTRMLEPLHREVKRDDTLMYRVQAPNLFRVRVNETRLDRKKSGEWEGEVTPPADLNRKTILVSGSGGQDITKLTGLYEFDIPDRAECRLFKAPPKPGKLTVGGAMCEPAFYPPIHPEATPSRRTKVHDIRLGHVYLY